MFLIRIQENGQRRERNLFSCPSLRDAQNTLGDVRSKYTNHWIRVYRLSDETVSGKYLMDTWGQGILRTNDIKTMGFLLDELTVMPSSMRKVETSHHMTPFNTMRRGKGRYSPIKKKKPTRHK